MQSTLECALEFAIRETNFHSIASLMKKSDLTTISVKTLVQVSKLDSPQAEGILSLLLEHPGADYNGAFPIVCLEGDCDILSLFLDSVPLLKITDECGINVIKSKSTTCLQRIVKDPRLVIKNPTLWISTCLQYLKDDMQSFCILSESGLFNPIACGSLFLAIYSNRQDVIQYLLDDARIKANLETDNIFKACLEYGSSDTFQLLLDNCYPSIDIQRISLLKGKEVFFEKIIQVCHDDDLVNLLHSCVRRCLKDKILLIYESGRIIFDTKLLCIAMNTERKDIIQYLLDAPFKISACSDDCCACLFFITSDQDIFANLLLTSGKCYHYRECLTLCLERNLPISGVYIANTIKHLDKQFAEKAVYCKDMLLARTILAKIGELDHKFIFKLINKPNKLGMLELVCETIKIDLTWKNCALVKFACTQPTSSALEHLLHSRIK